VYSHLMEHSKREFERYVRELRSKKPDELGMIAVRTPWCDAHSIFERGIPQCERDIRAALDAQIWFSKHGPAALQPLPLAEKEYCAMMRGSGPRYLLGYYSFSLQLQDYNYLIHPQFFDFARGVMAYDGTPKHVRNDPELLEEFPPKPLKGIHRMLWSPETDCTPIERVTTVTVQLSERHDVPGARGRISIPISV
jgi:hypothetical protein